MIRNLLLVISMISFSGCSSYKYGTSLAGPDKSTSTVLVKPSKGEDVFLSYLGLAIVMIGIFAVAPKEAYK